MGGFIVPRWSFCSIKGSVKTKVVMKLEGNWKLIDQIFEDKRLVQTPAKKRTLKIKCFAIKAVIFVVILQERNESEVVYYMESVWMFVVYISIETRALVKWRKVGCVCKLFTTLSNIYSAGGSCCWLLLLHLFTMRENVINIYWDMFIQGDIRKKLF